MNAGCAFFLIFYIPSVVVKDAATAREGNRRLSDVEPLLESIVLEQWEQDEAPCVEATLAILHGVKNSSLWATWIWDSMQRPAGFLYGSRYQLGSFDQCLKPPWLGSHPLLRTQYCLADVRLTDAAPRRQRAPLDPYNNLELYFETTSKHGRYFNVLSWGVCLPAACSQGSVRKMLRAMLRTQHLPPSTPELHITVDTCQQAGDPVEYSSEFKIFLILISSLLLLSILAMNISSYLSKNSLASQLVDSFDLKRNWQKYVEEPRDEISSVNGIKSINAGVMNTIHYVLFVNNTIVFNGLDVERDLDTSFGTSMIRSDITVDTFIFISGLLLVKGMYGKRNSLVVSLIKRYIRIIGPLAVMVFYFAKVHKYIGDGPLWPRLTSQEQEFCNKNWWLNLLMLPNYFNCSEMCYIVSWYIATDFHLAILGSALFYIHEKNSKLGQWLFGIIFAVTALIPAFVTFWFKISPLYFSSIQSMSDIYSNEVFLNVHIKTHCRIAVYLLGMFLGYFMSRFKPANYKNSIPKIWSIIGTAIAFYMMHKVLGIAGSFFHKDYDLMEATTFVAYDRICWATAIGVIILVSEYGYAPIVTDILKFKPFGGFSKLCYGIYLTHMVLVYRNIHSTRSPFKHDGIALIVSGVGVTFSILPVALLMYLIVEAPAGNLANCLFRSRHSDGYCQQILVPWWLLPFLDCTVIPSIRKPGASYTNGSVNGCVVIDETKNGRKSKFA